MKRFFRSIFRIFITLSLVGLLVLFVPRLVTAIHAAGRIQTVAEVTTRPVAIVFGAGLRRDGAPTAVLRERVARAVELYQAGKVQKLLLSGDNRSEYYDEPSAMRAYALELGVPDADIVRDYAGLSTYDTCYRAQAIFGVNSAILVTQNFHLPRALYTCASLGIDASGVAADTYTFSRSLQLFWNIREAFATLNALLEVNLTRPQPILGLPEPIFPNEA